MNKSGAVAIPSNFEAISKRAGEGLAANIYHQPIHDDKLDMHMQEKVDESRTFDCSYLERLSTAEKQDLENGDVLVTMNDIKGTWVKTAHAVALLNVRSSRVFEVITDFEQYEDYMPYISSVEVDRERSMGNVWYISYRLHFFLLPYIKNRYFTIKMIEEKLNGAQTGTHFLTWRLDPTSPSNFNRNSGSWKLVPCGEGGRNTLVFYTVLTNPGGLSPWFWRNISQKRVVRDILDSIREQAVPAPK